MSKNKTRSPQNDGLQVLTISKLLELDLRPLGYVLTRVVNKVRTVHPSCDSHEAIGPVLEGFTKIASVVKAMGEISSAPNDLARATGAIKIISSIRRLFKSESDVAQALFVLDNFMLDESRLMDSPDLITFMSGLTQNLIYGDFPVGYRDACDSLGDELFHHFNRELSNG